MLNASVNTGFGLNERKNSQQAGCCEHVIRFLFSEQTLLLMCCCTYSCQISNCTTQTFTLQGLFSIVTKNSLINEECNANGVKNRNDKADKQYFTELTAHVTKF